MPLTLLALAAGRSSRFGAPKQFAAVGPSAETLLDYALYDARRSGFDRAVLIVSAALRPRFESELVPRWKGRIGIELTEQALEPLPGGRRLPRGRTKPWGATQAIITARPLINRPFAVINGDDFYGRAAYASMHAFLQGGTEDWALVGYPLEATLPAQGAVTRARCRVSADGWLVDIEELENVRAGQGVAGTLVSMNFWGFTPRIFDPLGLQFERFLERSGGSLDAELPIPVAVSGLLAAGAGRVKVLPSGTEWCGLTNPGDVDDLKRFLAARVARGEYPSPLWATD